MTYYEILKCIAEKENLSVQEIENEMQKALSSAELNCSAEEFINTVTKNIKDYI